MIIKVNKLILCFLSISLFGCAQKPKEIISALSEPQKIKETDWAILPYERMFTAHALTLSDKQKQKFLDFYNASYNASVKPHKRIFNYLDQFINNFDYNNMTLPSTQALAKRTGNCMSLAMLTTSFANLVGLEISYQIINGAPLYYKQGKNIVTSQHVRTKIYAVPEPEEEGMVYFRKTHIIIDYYKNQLDLPGRTITSEEFLSMYYANLSADAYANMEYDLALKYSSNAMKWFPNSPENINTHALILDKLVDTDASIMLIEKALEQNITSLNLLNSYKILLEKTNQISKANVLNEQMENIDDDNPYRWLDIGHTKFDKKEYSNALRYYQKAELLAPYLDEVYLAQAKTYFKLGKKKASKEYLKKALESPIKVNEVKLYEAKLASFESY